MQLVEWVYEMVLIILLTPPPKNGGGDVFFVKIWIFELSLGPYFLSDFGFSHITIITATYARQLCALPPFWVSPLFCTNLQNQWIYFSDWMESCVWLDVVAEFEELFPIRLNFMKIRPAVCTWKWFGGPYVILSTLNRGPKMAIKRDLQVGY